MYRTILAALDIESRSDRPIISANRLAHELKADLRAVAVVRSALLATKGFFSAETVDRKAIMDEARSALNARVAAVDCTPTGTDVVSGKPSEAIVNVARNRGCDLIVLGAQPREGSELILGTTATNILRLSEGMDLYACHRPDPQTPVERITVAIDGSELSSRVLSVAQDLAGVERDGAAPEVQVVCVVDEDEGHSGSAVAAARRYLEPTAWHDLRVCVEAEGVVDAMEEAIRDFDSDLLIIGAGRNTGFGWAIGSTTNSLLHEISCDVLVTRR